MICSCIILYIEHGVKIMNKLFSTQLRRRRSHLNVWFFIAFIIVWCCSLLELARNWFVSFFQEGVVWLAPLLSPPTQETSGGLRKCVRVGVALSITKFQHACLIRLHQILTLLGSDWEKLTKHAGEAFHQT